MASFTVDPSNPEMVLGPGGGMLPRYAVDPADIATAAPAQPMTAADVLAKRDAILPPTPPLSPAAQAVLAKRDAVLPMVQTGATHSRSVQRGVPQAQLQPVLDANTRATEDLATTVEQQGAARTERATQGAERQLYQAQGGRAVAEAEREDAAQRAEIARMNQLAIASQTDPEIDPDRVVREMSTGKQIGMVILAALQGAFNATNDQPGQPNQVLSIIQNRIAQDIAAQREQIASGRIRRGNMVNFFREQGMSEEAAVKAAEARSLAMVERMAQAEAALLTAPEAKEQGALLAQQMRAQVQAKNAELQLSLGTDRVSEQSSTTMARPQAAPTSAKAIVDEMRAQRDMAQLERSNLTQEEYDKQAAEYAEKAAKQRDYLSTVEDLVATIPGLRLVDRNGRMEIEGEPQLLDDSGFDPTVDVGKAAESNRAIDRAYRQLQRADVMGMLREPSAQLQNEFAENSTRASRQAMKGQLQFHLDLAQRAEQDIRAGKNPVVIRDYDRATGRTDGPTPTPEQRHRPPDAWKVR